MVRRRTAGGAHHLPRFRRDERASATLVSYVLAAAVFILSTSVLLSFVAEPPGGPASGLEQHDLKSKANGALDVLMGTPGYPDNWVGEGPDGVARLGLVEPGASVRLDPTKFGALARGKFYYASDANGFVDYTEARHALGLDGYDFHIRGSPLLRADDEFYGTKGMGDYRVAYVGDYSGTPATASTAAVWEQAALKDLDIGFTNVSRTGILGTGDVFQDDSTLLRNVLVPLLGTRVAQVAINGGSGQAHDFNRVNSSDIDHIVSPSLLSDSEKSLALSRLDSHDEWVLGYTKGREIRATIGSINTTDHLSVLLAWKEHVDTKGSGSTRDEGDYGYLEASPDGGATWYPLTSGLADRSQDTTADPQTANVWTDRSFTLSAATCAACVDQDEVILALHWVADSDSTIGYGWLLDDFLVTSTGLSPQILALKDFESPEYDLLVIGSNVDQEALTPSEVKNAIRDYVQAYEGRILVLGGQTNNQWLQPLFHVALIESANPGVASPDPTHPLLTVPNELDWQGYEEAEKAWDFGGGPDESLFDMVVGNEDGQHVLTVSGSGVFSAEGGVILTSWLPYDLDREQRLPFLANAITYGRFRHLYMEVGPEVPSGEPVASVSRTAVMQKTTDEENPEYVEIGFVLYLWRGNASASLPSVSLPSVPRSFAASPDDREVVLTWSSPLHKGSVDLSGYNVYRGTSPGYLPLHRQVGPNDHGLTDTGLANGVTYYYKVTARNANGEGPATGQLDATPSAAPSAPEALTTTGAAGYITLTWNAPATNGGSAVTAYRIHRSTSASVTPSSQPVLAEIGTNTSYVDAGLGFPFQAWYQVVAVNAQGPGAASSTATASTVSVPGTPPTPVAAPGAGSITLTWTPPTAGSGISGYEVFSGTSPGSTAYLATTSSTTYTDNGLGAGTTRYYRVRAYGPGGMGGLSDEVSATTLTLPSEPNALAATGGADKVTLTWAPPSDLGGGTISHYRIYHGTASGSLTLLTNTVNGANVSFDHAGLADSSTHYYRVSAVNAAGEGTQASEVAATTWDVASAPTLTGVPGPGSKTVTLTWVAPNYAGGTGAIITKYWVYRGTSAGSLTYFGESTGLAYTDDKNGNQALTTYYYQVRAVTGAGLGAASNTVGVVMPP